ncbi:MAG: RNA repair transcriptional activator RtcR [Deltaproteobacteria bacterium]|nr:RNA repair transcriptional activator RtcR [Deltaproteobacteria bacterium]
MNPSRVIGLLGPVLDRADRGRDRWDKWRPTVAVCQHEDLLVERFELLYQRRFRRLAEQVCRDIRSVSPETAVCPHAIELADPWDFEEVYGVLYDFVQAYDFDLEHSDYLVHITTGSHVAQICWFLLCESRHLPARLLQTSPPKRGAKPLSAGDFSVIDLDLSRYDKLMSRFARATEGDICLLKSGIQTRNPVFNELIARIEKVALGCRDPILLMGATGAGKSHLARRIYELKRSHHQLAGAFVEVNCATLRGDALMSTLFGHEKGAFTGATRDRPGLLRAADSGLLFLDEVAELGLDEQAMLLRAIEEKRFLPLGADREAESDFQLICGTNRDLQQEVAQGRFREDLLVRIHLWTFCLPGLAERSEDIEPNLSYELEHFGRTQGVKVVFQRDAARDFLDFATSPRARWSANFRDLNGAVRRMAVLAADGRIDRAIVREEIARLEASWATGASPGDAVAELLGEAEIDLFDRAQLAEVIRVCRASRSLSEAGRELFAVSRQKKKSSNDADRLRKYLARFGLRWEALARADR